MNPIKPLEDNVTKTYRELFNVANKGYKKEDLKTQLKLHQFAIQHFKPNEKELDTLVEVISKDSHVLGAYWSEWRDAPKIYPPMSRNLENAISSVLERNSKEDSSLSKAGPSKASGGGQYKTFEEDDEGVKLDFDIRGEDE